MTALVDGIASHGFDRGDERQDPRECAQNHGIGFSIRRKYRSITLYGIAPQVEYDSFVKDSPEKRRLDDA